MTATNGRHPAAATIASIIGDPTPFAIELRSPPGGGTPQLALAHSCGAGGTFGIGPADPAVRVAAFASAFGSRGVVTSVCPGDLSPQVTQIGRLLEQPLGVVCVDTTGLTDSAPAPGVQPRCEVVERLGADRLAIPACPGDCFELVVDAAACAEISEHLRLVIHRAAPAREGAYVTARCELAATAP